MAYEVVMPYHLHMPSYFLETFTEYPEVFTDLYKTKPPSQYKRILLLIKTAESRYKNIFLFFTH